MSNLLCEWRLGMTRPQQLNQKDANGNATYDIFFELRRLAVGGCNRKPKLCMVKRPIMDACRQRAELAAEHPMATSKWVYLLHVRNEMRPGFRGGHAYVSGRFIRHHRPADRPNTLVQGEGPIPPLPPSDELDSGSAISVLSSSTETNTQSD